VHHQLDKEEWMSKRIIAVSLVLILFGALGAFATEQKSKTFPWMATYDRTGQLNLYASVGWYGYGLDVVVGPEFIISSFDLAGIPLSFGVSMRGMVGFGSFLGYAAWIDWGVAPLATLHWGVDLGSILKFDWYAGLGLGINGTTGTYWAWPGGIGFGFASFDGIAWHFSDNLALVLEYAYNGYASMGGIGVELSL
jgi:hypothetical protein